MDVRTILSSRIGIDEIRFIVAQVPGNNELQQDLCQLLFDSNDILAYQAAWVLTHLPKGENLFLIERQDELIDELLTCLHPGKRRLLLNLLLEQPLPEPLRVDFLDFCLACIIARDELPGVQTLCMKLAYKMCRPIPELLHELRSILEIMEPSMLPPSILSVRTKVLKAIRC